MLQIAFRASKEKPFKPIVTPGKLWPVCREGRIFFFLLFKMIKEYCSGLVSGRERKMNVTCWTPMNITAYIDCWLIMRAFKLPSCNKLSDALKRSCCLTLMACASNGSYLCRPVLLVPFPEFP